MVTLPTVAAAQPEQSEAPTAGDEAAARAHFATAEAHYKNGDYAAAASEYLAAYAVQPLPALLLNAAQAYRMLGDEQAALAHYREFVKLAPDHEFADDARGYITDLEASLAAKATEPEPALEPEIEPPGKTASHASNEPVAEPVGSLIVDPAPPDRTLEIAGMATAGAGVVLLGTAAYFGFKGQDLERQVQDLGIDCTIAKPDSRCKDGNAANTAAYVSLGIGAAAVATGAVLYYMGARQEESRPGAVAVAPQVSSSGLGVAIAGRF